MPDTYYKFGPTAGNATPHWYEFLYDGSTGAVIDNAQHTITLHFVDGERGDDDLVANGTIVDPGGTGNAAKSAPTGINLSNRRVDENLTAGATVGLRALSIPTVWTPILTASKLEIPGLKLLTTH